MLKVHFLNFLLTNASILLGIHSKHEVSVDERNIHSYMNHMFTATWTSSIMSVICVLYFQR
jgi:hypothetical protein